MLGLIQYLISQENIMNNMEFIIRHDQSIDFYDKCL